MACRNDYTIRYLLRQEGLFEVLRYRAKRKQLFPDGYDYSILWYIKQWWYNVRRRN